MKIGKITKEIRPILSKLGDYFRNKAHFQQIFLNCEKIMGKSNVNINQTKTIAWCIFSNLLEEWLPVLLTQSISLFKDQKIVPAVLMDTLFLIF